MRQAKQSKANEQLATWRIRNGSWKYIIRYDLPGAMWLSESAFMVLIGWTRF